MPRIHQKSSTLFNSKQKCESNTSAAGCRSFTIERKCSGTRTGHDSAVEAGSPLLFGVLIIVYIILNHLRASFNESTSTAVIGTLVECHNCSKAENLADCAGFAWASSSAVLSQRRTGSSGPFIISS